MEKNDRAGFEGDKFEGDKFEADKLKLELQTRKLSLELKLNYFHTIFEAGTPYTERPHCARGAA